ncbi:hypothetical protein AAMO2058_000050000 [Amorphochlora amoebiformis]
MATASDPSQEHILFCVDLAAASRRGVKFCKKTEPLDQEDNDKQHEATYLDMILGAIKSFMFAKFRMNPFVNFGLIELGNRVKWLVHPNQSGKVEWFQLFQAEFRDLRKRNDEESELKDGLDYFELLEKVARYVDKQIPAQIILFWCRNGSLQVTKNAADLSLSRIRKYRKILTGTFCLDANWWAYAGAAMWVISSRSWTRSRVSPHL